MSFNQNLSSAFSRQKKFSRSFPWSMSKSFLRLCTWNRKKNSAGKGQTFCECQVSMLSGHRGDKMNMVDRRGVGHYAAWVLCWGWKAFFFLSLFFFFLESVKSVETPRYIPYSVLLESHYISQKTCLLKWKHQRPPPSPQPRPLQLQYVLYWSQGCYFDCCCS